jgi:hypothetical protein
MPSPREKIMWRKALQKAILDNDSAAEKKYRDLLKDKKKSAKASPMSKRKSIIT